VEWMVKKMKPIIQQLFVRGKKLLSRDLTPYELQIYFAFQKEDKLKKVTKLLAKEKKAENSGSIKSFTIKINSVALYKLVYMFVPYHHTLQYTENSH
jgi:hypothetical protein